jgi:hypothetical protein
VTIHRLESVVPIDEHLPRLQFEDGSEHVFDVKPYLDTGIFRELRDADLYASARLEYGGVAWPGGQSLSP